MPLNKETKPILHMVTPVLADKQKFTFISSVGTQGMPRRLAKSDNW